MTDRQVDHVARDRTARTRIRQYLADSGPLEEASGHATSALKEAIDYQGSPVAFIQLIAAMDRDGEIEREIRGKRTYRITGTGRSATGIAPAVSHGQGSVRMEAHTTDGTAVAVDIDYDRLAKALVREFLGAVASGERPAMEDEVDAARLAAERDDYVRRLEEAREKLDELLGDPNAPAPRPVVGTTA